MWWTEWRWDRFCPIRFSTVSVIPPVPHTHSFIVGAAVKILAFLQVCLAVICYTVFKNTWFVIYQATNNDLFIIFSVSLLEDTVIATSDRSQWPPARAVFSNLYFSISHSAL